MPLFSIFANNFLPILLISLDPRISLPQKVRAQFSAKVMDINSIYTSREQIISSDRIHYQTSPMTVHLLIQVNGNLTSNKIPSNEADDSMAKITDLWRSFPEDASDAALASAESDSFILHLHETQDPLSLQSLIWAYSDGLLCQHGVIRALDPLLDQLCMYWRLIALGENSKQLALQKFLLNLLLLEVMLVIPAWQLRMNMQ